MVDIAIEMWEEALQVAIDEDQKTFDLMDEVTMASICLCKHKFDSMHATLVSSPEIPAKEKESLWLELNNYVEYTAKASPHIDRWGLSTGDRYKAVWCFLAGKDETARRMCSNDLLNAIEILSDDDEDNDSMGVEYLINVFCRNGDKISALSAWSLLDRRARGTTANSGSDQDTDPAGATDTAEGSYPSKWCSGCPQGMFTSDPKGIWYCRFCPDLYLCPRCHGKMQQGNLNTHLCNPNHEFWHFYHTEYMDEEVAHGKSGSIGSWMIKVTDSSSGKVGALLNCLTGWRSFGSAGSCRNRSSRVAHKNEGRMASISGFPEACRQFVGFLDWKHLIKFDLCRTSI